MAAKLTEIQKRAMALYTGPFRYEHGYIYDSQNNMVADEDSAVISRIRGWGRIQYMPEAESLQDAVGELVAQALTKFWLAQQAPAVFAYRRKGLEGFVTCSEEQYNELAQKELFEVAKFVRID